MKTSSPLRHFAIAFALALVLYFVAFHFIENRRTRNGPWQVTFTNQNGSPTLLINEAKLKIADVKLAFPGEPAAATNATLSFAVPQAVPFAVPFGECKFEDTTFQPGTIVFTLFGHEVQLLPRALTIDKQDYAWQSGAIITVNKANTSRGVP